MKITDVKVFPVDEEKLKAYATITFENCFIVRDLKVISGNKGYFIAMPSKKRKDGTFRDVAHPLNSETRKMIEEAVLEVYEREAVALGSAPPTADTGTAAGEESETAEPAPVSEEGSDQETPSEDESGQETPSEDESGQETPSEDESGQKIPSEDGPGEETPPEDGSGQEIPSEDGPGEETPSEEQDPESPSERETTDTEGSSKKKSDIVPEDPEKAFGYEE